MLRMKSTVAGALSWEGGPPWEQLITLVDSNDNLVRAPLNSTIGYKQEAEMTPWKPPNEAPCHKLFGKGSINLEVW